MVKIKSLLVVIDAFFFLCFVAFLNFRVHQIVEVDTQVTAILAIVMDHTDFAQFFVFFAPLNTLYLDRSYRERTCRRRIAALRFQIIAILECSLRWVQIDMTFFLLFVFFGVASLHRWYCFLRRNLRKFFFCSLSNVRSMLFLFNNLLAFCWKTLHFHGEHEGRTFVFAIRKDIDATSIVLNNFLADAQAETEPIFV